VSGLTNTIAIVTGGASGIGRSLCSRLSQRGATVIIADVNAQEAQKVVEGIHEYGGQGQAYEVDVSQGDDIQSFMDDVVRKYGQIDYMFNNAGIEINGEILSVESGDWSRGVDINLKGVMYGTNAAYRIMVEQGFGHIVNTASIAGLIPLPGLSYYAATKHAVVGFSLSLREEAKASGIKVSVVCPTLVSTDIRTNTAKILSRDVPEYTEFPLGRRLEAEDCAEQILRGVLRNRAIIIIPRVAGVLWWMSRFSPVVFNNTVAALYARIRKTT
jgi:NAD(P)-dependent dehydrogenase (short-subunit alcohol dehydrogenase family)